MANCRERPRLLRQRQSTFIRDVWTAPHPQRSTQGFFAAKLTCPLLIGVAAATERSPGCRLSKAWLVSCANKAEEGTISRELFIQMTFQGESWLSGCLCFSANPLRLQKDSSSDKHPVPQCPCMLVLGRRAAGGGGRVHSSVLFLQGSCWANSGDV